ncbi:MAG: response regulator [Desulfobacterales bacterium]|jgi:signal transduction histidine kinase/CheY-like chemotaxis protein
METQKKDRESIMDSMIIAGFSISIIYWVLDSILNIFFSNKYNIIAELIGPDLYDIYLRIVVLCLFIIFGSHAQSTINRLRRARDFLRTSDERYRALFEYNPIESIIVDNDARVTGYNLAKARSGDRLPSGGDIMYRDYAAKHKIDMYQELKNCIASGRSGEFPELEYGHKYLHVRIAPFSNGAIITSIDNTEQKRLQRQLQQSQKMEAIATLAGGIAHQFNNILSGITGNAELLQNDYSEDEKIHRHTGRILESAYRMTRLNDQLLAYARGGKYRPSVIALPQLVEDTLTVLKPSLDPNLTIRTDYQPNVPFVWADVTQIQMVFSAVLNNASEATVNTGRIDISVTEKTFDEAYTRNHPGLNPGRYIVLRVKDDGKGMDKDTIGRIFDPFFTTKLQGRGLGMAAVYGIVKNHDGWIGIDSDPGKGTSVRILLPVLREIPLEKKPITTDSAPGTGTVLVIDDEEDILDVCRSILERLGYTVLEARTGKEALEFAEELKDRIDLVILDVAMPDIPGDQLCQMIKEIQPRMKILVSTGYAVEDLVDSLKRETQGFIQKPISFSKLSAKIKEVMRD